MSDTWFEESIDVRDSNTVVHIRRGMLGRDSTVVVEMDPRHPFVSDEMAAQDAELLARWLRGAIPARTLQETLDKIEELRGMAKGLWEATGEFEKPFFEWYKEQPAEIRIIPRDLRLDNPYDRED
jgi:hypothetical protein